MSHSGEVGHNYGDFASTAKVSQFVPHKSGVGHYRHQTGAPVPLRQITPSRSVDQRDAVFTVECADRDICAAAGDVKLADSIQIH